MPYIAYNDPMAGVWAQKSAANESAIASLIMSMLAKKPVATAAPTAAQQSFGGAPVSTGYAATQQNFIDQINALTGMGGITGTGQPAPAEMPGGGYRPDLYGSVLAPPKEKNDY